MSIVNQTSAVGTKTIVAAAALNIPLGWQPRYIRAYNVNNLVSYEYFYGMDAGTSLDNGNHDNTQNSVNAADSISLFAGRTPGAAVSGTVAVTAASATVAGTNTNFLGELAVGGTVTINGETRTIAAIASKTSLTVDSAIVTSASGVELFDLEGQEAGFTLGTDICDTTSDVVRWLAIR